MTRAAATLLALAAVLVLPSRAEAGPALALRGGWAPSFGEAAANVPMSETVWAQVPLQLDALWRHGALAAGAYASYGLGMAGGCEVGARCAASSWRVGAQAAWTFPTFRAGIEPWGGAGAGYEWISTQRERAGTEVEYVYRGAELASLQAGADVRVGRRIAVGPFLLLAVGRYTHLSLDTPDEHVSAEIDRKRFHAWVEIGVRCVFDP